MNRIDIKTPCAYGDEEGELETDVPPELDAEDWFDPAFGFELAIG